MMAEHIYNVGDRITIGPPSEPYGMVEVKSTTTNADGKRQITSEVIELVQGYSGNLKVGTTLTCAEDEFVGTFTQPAGGDANEA